MLLLWGGMVCVYIIYVYYENVIINLFFCMLIKEIYNFIFGIVIKLIFK